MRTFKQTTITLSPEAHTLLKKLQREQGIPKSRALELGLWDRYGGKNVG